LKFEVLTAVKIQVQVFWVVMLWYVAVRYQHIWGPSSKVVHPLKCWYPATILHIVTTQTTSTWIRDLLFPTNEHRGHWHMQNHMKRIKKKCIPDWNTPFYCCKLTEVLKYTQEAQLRQLILNCEIWVQYLLTNHRKMYKTVCTNM
jgi:hypothetical protein